MSGSRHSKDYERFLERLRQAREEAQLSQVQVAEQLGRTQVWVSRCELGERRVDVVELANFAKLYGWTLDDFVA